MTNSRLLTGTDSTKCGVAISNFECHDKSYTLNLLVGDCLVIEKECGEWFYGYLRSNPSESGIFPKNYVHIKSYEDAKKISKDGDFASRESDIVQEVADVLREWAPLWCQLYQQRSPDFETIRTKVYELIELRQTIMSGNLPADQLKVIIKDITNKINVGNLILGLDMIVWDDFGNILNPKLTSTIEMYRAHEIISRRVKEAAAGYRISDDHLAEKLPTSLMHFSLYVTLNNCTCRIGEDADILVTLYDAKEQKFISENYVVQWSSQGLMKEFAKSPKARVIFCDLGSRDLKRGKVFIVCQIIRRGAMELKESESGYRGKASQSRKDAGKRSIEGIRRPFGVAALDVTDILLGQVESDGEKQFFLPLVQCFEKDTLDSTTRKAVSSKGAEISEKEHKNQGVWISYKLLQGDLDQARGDSPHLVSPFTQIARRMGFPEIILPGDVRNDLYVTLVSGEFSSKAINAKNIEVSIKVCNSTGTVHQQSITMGPGLALGSEYKSVVYHHDERPKWMETIKVSLSIEDFCESHLRVTFKHRSSNESKDKQKPFAFSFIKLLNDNGTTLQDRLHDLLIYKIDWKKFDDSDNNVNYLNNLPSTRSELESKSSKSSSHSPKSSNNIVPGLTLIPSDVCTISTIVCSTKLTQNIDLLGLLKYPADSANDSDLKACLRAFMKVDGEEIVKFLQDILDSLFNILQGRESEDLIDLVFQSFVFIIGLISDTKYHRFRPILDGYIQMTFSFSLAYVKLVSVLQRYIENLALGHPPSDLISVESSSELVSARQTYETEWIPRFMQSLEYLFKFIARSRGLYLKLKEVPTNDILEFRKSLENLFLAFSNLMSIRTQASLQVQQLCLKYFSAAIPDIVTVYDRGLFSQVLTNLMPSNKLEKEKLLFMLDIIHCEALFSDPKARKIILPVFTQTIKTFMGRKVELHQCIKVLSEILISLYLQPFEKIEQDVNILMETILWTVIQSVMNRKSDDIIIKSLVAVMIDIFRLMTPSHYEAYMEMYQKSRDSTLLEFLVKVLMLFEDLVSFTVFPKDWNEMIMLQNTVILVSLKQFGKRMRKSFVGEGYGQLWQNFFSCAISFVSQEALQLENFSSTKRSRLKKRYGDMRRDLTAEIRAMWMHLDKDTVNFVPHMIGPFLEMALIPDEELRRIVIPIFYDIMIRKFSTEAYEMKEFQKCQEEMIRQLDRLFEARKGDEEFRKLFREEMFKKFENNQFMGDLALKSVNIICNLMLRLLEYRTMISDKFQDNIECQMICLVNLLEFYLEHGCEELYIRYLYKLFDLHIACENFAEAAYVLWYHATPLKWCDDPIPLSYRVERFSECKTQRELKEKLYKSMIEYFEKGQLWEEGIVVCQEFIDIIYQHIFDFVTLSKLHEKISSLYLSVVKETRNRREYYRVGYYGHGFPPFLRNKVFIHRGKNYERLSDFTKRLMDGFPDAKILEPTVKVDAEIKDSEKQCLQINSADPVVVLPENVRERFLHPNIISFYELNRVNEFYCSRVFKKDCQPGEIEAASIWLERVTMKTKYVMPGIAPCFLVIETSIEELPPIQIAIEDLEKKQSEFIRELSCYYFNIPNQNTSSLLSKIQGVVEAAVNGGIRQYEKAFLCPEFMNRSDSLSVFQKDELMKKLKNSILSLIPLINIAFALVESKLPAALEPLYQHLCGLYKDMRHSMELKYKNGCNFDASPKLSRVIEEFAKKGLASSGPVERSTEKLVRSSFTQSTGKGRSRSVLGLNNHSSWNSNLFTSHSLPYKNQFNSIHRKSKDASNTKWFDQNEANGELSETKSSLDLKEVILPSSHSSFRHTMQHAFSSSSLGPLITESRVYQPDETDGHSENHTSLPPLLPPKHSSNDLKVRSRYSDYFNSIRSGNHSLPSQAFRKRPLPNLPTSDTSINGSAIEENKAPLLPRKPRSSHSLSVPSNTDPRDHLV